MICRASISVACTAIALLQGCAPSRAAAPPAPTTLDARFQPWGVDLTAMNRSVRPGNDFYEYVNGSWQDSATIPADHPASGVYSDIMDEASARLRAIVEGSAAHPTTRTARLISDIYSAYVDTARLEQLGGAPLAADLDHVRRAADREELARLMGQVQDRFGRGFFTLSVIPDAKHPDGNYVLRLQQGGLTLDREAYMGDGAKRLQPAYRAYVEHTLDLIHWPHPDSAAAAVVAMESRIAAASWPVADRFDQVKTYNPRTVDELIAAAPGFPWRAYLAGAGLPSVQRVIAAEVTAIPGIAAIYAATPIETLRAWEAFQIAEQAAPYLSRPFAHAHFAFRDSTINGVITERPRADRAVQLTSDLLGEAVGREYVARYFPPTSKAMMLDIAANVKSAMGDRIRNLAWMSPATKHAALAKLANVRILVGYPDRWRDYSTLQTSATDLYGDVARAKAFEWAYSVAKLGRRVDRDEWLETPQTSDAYSSFTRMHTAFPAGFLLPPIFDPHADMAVNYGAIGGVIGHEITHQFDSQGRKFDSTGAIDDWWTSEDAQHFEQEADRLAAQFDAYEVLPGVHINGHQTVGENIADLGGLVLALDAYHRALRGKPAPVLNGFTGDQRLLLSWAQQYRAKLRDDLRRRIAAVDVHADPMFRVIGPTRDVDTWYGAFGVAKGDRYYLTPEERVRIW